MPSPANVRPPTASPFWNVFPWWLVKSYRSPLVSLTTLLVIPLVLIYGWLYRTHERQWRRQESADLLVTARLASRIVQEELTQTREIEAAIAARANFVEAVKRRDGEALTASLQILLDAKPMIDQARVVDGSGKVLAALASLGAAEHSLVDAPDDVPRLDPPAQDAVSGVYLTDKASGTKGVRISSLIRDQRSMIGAVQAQYSLEGIAQWLEKVRVEPAGFLYVADQHRCLVAHPFQLLPGQPKNISDWPPAAADASPEGTIIRFTQGHPPRPWTGAVVSVEPFGWRVVAQQPDGAMLKPFRQLMWSFAALIAGLAGLLSVLIVRWAQLHHATLRLVAQQTRLLRVHQQRRLRAMLRRSKRTSKRSDHVA